MTVETNFRHSFNLPLRGSNDDHLDIFASEGEAFGAALGEQVASNLRIASGHGLKGASVRDYLGALARAGLFVQSASEGVRFARLGVGLDATFERAMIATVRGDLRVNSDNLIRRGYRDNQVARFRVCAWRAFKLAIREAEKMKAH